MNKFTSKKVTLRRVMLLLLLVGISIHQSFGQNPPTNVKAVSTHSPSWYSVKVSWNIPDGESPSASVWDKSTFITHPGQGYDGNDASAIMEGFGTIGYYGTQQRGYSLADQFTLSTAAELDSIHFFTIQPAAPEINPAAHAKEIYVRIYDKAPNEGGSIIWGNFVTNLKYGTGRFSNVYRVYEDNLTAHLAMTDYGFPIMEMTATLDVDLPAGTYWLEVTGVSNIPIYASPNANIVFCPITIIGVTDTGNALQCDVNGNWSAIVDQSNGGKAGIAMEIFGKAAGVYNIYRDGVKLNDEPVADLSYADIVPGAGVYEYGVTTVGTDGGESEPATTTITVEPDPCGEAIAITDVYTQGFENGMADCWRNDADEYAQAWEAALLTESLPATAHRGSRKAFYQAGEGAVTRLVTTKFDLTQLSEPKLSFWHTQKADEEIQDELRVYYRNTETADWTLLAEYTTEIADWTKATIALPEPTATYWLAFEGTGNGGYGIMLDDILIYDEGGITAGAVTNLTYTMNTPPEEWYNVHLAWDFPENGIAGDNIQLWNNGPLVTHPGAGYGGADVCAVEDGCLTGNNITAVEEWGMADDFTLDRPTYISQMVFYCYEYFQSNDPTNIKSFNVIFYDKNPQEGGVMIWGGYQNDCLNREATKFSNIYRAYIDEIEQPTRPLIRVVTDIDLILPAGTYWVYVSADPTTEPSKGGAVFMPPVTVLGEPDTGNALHEHSYQWAPWETGKGQADMPFEIYGKPIYSGFDVYRDGSKVNESPVAYNFYTDVSPGEGSYNYCVKAAWEDGAVSGEACIAVDMPADPCETPISGFPYLEDFEGEEVGYLAIDCWRYQYIAGGAHGSQRKWEIGNATTNRPNTAVSGNRKAIYTGVGGNVTKLVTPMFDLTSLANPRLKFWHAQGNWDGYQNELRIFYKTSAAGEWVKIAEYTGDIPDWVEESYALPEPSATYWIAFEGYGDLGRYLMLDDIRIADIASFSITANAGSGGSINPAGVTELEEGEDLAFTITPDAGYEIESVLVDGEDMGKIESYIFTKVAQDHTITAVFKLSVGIEEVGNTNLAVYPNPTTGLVHIKGSGANIKEVCIYETTGNLLYRADNINSPETDIDLTPYGNGIYLIKVDNKVVKVVKKK